MNRSRKNIRRYVLWIGGIALYLLALILLTAVESADPNASIQTWGDAFWYSLVTMSTVGYGDLYPVTAAGKVLGMVFVLLSLGMLTFVISLMIKLVTGKMLPALKLWRLRKKPWFVFSCASEEAKVLAENLQQTYPEGVFLFPGEEADNRFVPYPGTMEALAARKKENCTLFYMDGEYEQAVQALALGHPVYCMSQLETDGVPQGLTLFNRYDCCARHYWQNNAVTAQEKNILLIGHGPYAQNLLTRALLVNVFGRARSVRYHVFGPWQDYRNNYHRLNETLLINENRAGQDSLHFHECWNADPQLLLQADRIIVCGEDVREDLQILTDLRKFFPVKGKVHLRSDSPIPGVSVFGMASEVFTQEMVMRRQLTVVARTMHQIYLESTGAQTPSWEELSEFLRQSNIAAADHLLTKLRILLGDDTLTDISREICAKGHAAYRALDAAQKDDCRRMEHDRWMRFHSLYNWEYAEKRDNSARKHPMMLPYDELSEAEQRKDEYAWELLEQIAEKI